MTVWGESPIKEETGALVTYMFITALPDFQHKEEPKPQYILSYIDRKSVV